MIKHFKQLEKKKVRQETMECKIEGEKTICEYLYSTKLIKTVYASPDLYEIYRHQFPNVHFEEASEHDISRSSFSKTNTSMIALVQIPEQQLETPTDFMLALDDISDPGNLGTIIRICDWYGIKNIICNAQTVDCYNPKVISSTKGSLARVNIFYTDLEEYLEKNTDYTVYGAFLDGESIHEKKDFGEKKLLIIGNESHGVSPKLEKYISQKITIPSFGEAESLNAGVACGIIVDRIVGK
ncbi:RNA methyltransferase [Candidatus Gracilibacteria bacterium]|nr:RNA methyltransferase [Candidatus Gracilibacteria bacterium]MBS9775149.1 RNA methyltransferase [Candidatus Gracilibacteria bacterium]